MTRFARARGSKANKQHIPDSGTSWKEIKEGMQKESSKNSHLSFPDDSNKNPHFKTMWSSFSQNCNKGGDTRKSKKLQKNKEYKRRKPYPETNKVFINGNEIELSYFDGFPIKKSDAERLKQLKREMISKGLPRNEINKALKLERRKAEKLLAREKKKVCFNCRHGGHTISECPKLESESNIGNFQTGICFKCGSTEHTHFECKVNPGGNFKFALCFVCKEQGHIARQCPDNNRGIYPRGGACKLCGDVTHLKKDCPTHQEEKASARIVAYKIDYTNVEVLENDMQVKKSSDLIKKQKKVKY